jgi:flagellar protein FlaG
MRISSSVSLDANTTSRTATAVKAENVSVEKTAKQVEAPKPSVKVEQNIGFNENSEETKQKVQEAVTKLNEMLDVNDSTSKFMYHEGLDRYYVTIVDKKTEEVVKEIPARKLLDSYYEMQKMLGMIVDEKI